MSKTTKLTDAQAKHSVGTTDWSQLKGRTDAEIEAAAASDPNARTFAPQELRQFKRVSSKLTSKGSK